MSKKQNTSELGSASSDLLEALERLKRNDPTKSLLILRASKGKLKINCWTVAHEAGRSRTLIGMAGCALPDVRAKVLEAEVESGVYKLRTQAVRDARAEVQELKEQLLKSSTGLACALSHIEFLEAKLQQYEPINNVARIGHGSGRSAAARLDNTV